MGLTLGGTYERCKVARADAVKVAEAGEEEGEVFNGERRIGEAVSLWE